MTDKPKAFIYGRVSSEKQLAGTSIEIQSDINEAKKIAEKYGCTLSTKKYIDDGVSAFDGNNIRNGALRDLISDVKNGVIKRNDLIIMRALDRFSRTTVYKSNAEFANLLSMGIRVYTTMDDTLYGGTSNNKVMDSIISIVSLNTAWEESSKKSALNNDYILKRVQQYNDGVRGENNAPYHHGKSIPFHCELQGTYKNKVVVKHHKNFEISKVIISLALKGWGFHKIIKHLRELYEISRTKQWLKDYLKSPSLYGNCILNIQNRSRPVYEPYKESFEKSEYILEGYYPAVCSKNEWLALQQVRKKSSKIRTTGQKYYTLLSGRQRLYCSCGKPLTSLYGKGTSTPIYYACIDQVNCKNIEQIFVLNNVLASSITSYLKHRVESSSNNELDLKISTLLEKEVELNKELSIKFKQSDDYPDAYMERNAPLIVRLNNRLNQVKANIDELKGQKSFTKLPTQNLEFIIKELEVKKEELLYGSSEENFRNGELIYKIINKITLGKDGLIVIEFENASKEYYYFPLQNKNKGRRVGYSLNIFKTKEELENYSQVFPELAITNFTKDDLANKRYECDIKDVNPSLLRLFSHPRTKLAKDILIDKVSNHVQKSAYFIMEKNFAVKNSFSERQFYMYRAYIEEYFKSKHMLHFIKYKTKLNQEKSLKVILLNEKLLPKIDNYLKHNLNNYFEIV